VRLPRLADVDDKSTTMRKHVLFSVAAFFAFGFAGPLIQRGFWPPASFLILIWPALMLGSGGTARTLQRELAITGGINVVFFALAGLLIARVATRTRTVVGIYLGICALVVSCGAWGAGFSLAFFSWKDVGAAVLLYLLPFCVVWWSARRLGPAGD